MNIAIAIYLSILGVAGISNVADYASKRAGGHAAISAVFVVINTLFAVYLLLHR